MNGFGGEVYLYGGIAIMGVAIGLAVVCVIVFRITGRKINNQLEQEYGKRR